MTIFEITSDLIQPLSKTTFGAMQVQERRGLQRLLRENIAVIAPDTLVISEEYSEWDDSRRRIDLLGIDRDANLVVIELKRTEDGGHMELQAIRYAAMVSTMTFEQAVSAYSRFLRQSSNGDVDAKDKLLDFLGWDEPDEDKFAQRVKIVLAAGEFSSEVTTAVLWLNKCGLDIRCVRLQPYHFSGRLLVDVQQIIPLPEAAEYQVRVSEKVRKEYEARTISADYTKFDLRLGSQEFPRESKRWAILRTVRYLVVDCGVVPETVAKHCGPRASRALQSVAGVVGSDDFVRLAGESRAELGSRFDPVRWFYGDNELMQVGGRTYVFSSQWGGDDWMKAMNNLKEAFPDHGIDFWPTVLVL